jgi:hypothetical protein
MAIGGEDMRTSRIFAVFLLFLFLILYLSHEYRHCEWEYENVSLVGVGNGKAITLRNNTLLILNISDGNILKKFRNIRVAFLIGNKLSMVEDGVVINFNLENFAITKLDVPEGVNLNELIFGVNLGNFSLYSTRHPVRERYNFDVITYYVCARNCTAYSLKAPPGSYPWVYIFPEGYLLTFETNDAFTKGSAIVLGRNGSLMGNLSTEYAISDFEYCNGTLFFSTGGTEPGGTLIAGGNIYAFSLNGSLKWHVSLRHYDSGFYDWAIAGLKIYGGRLYAVGYTGRIYVFDFGGKIERIINSPVYKRLKTPSLIKGIEIAKDDVFAFAYLDIKTSGVFRESTGICVYDFNDFNCWKTRGRVSKLLLWRGWVIAEEVNPDRVCVWQEGTGC